MKNFPKTILSLGLSLLTIGAMAQPARPFSEKTSHLTRSYQHGKPYFYAKHNLRHSLTAYSYYLLNYDSADAITNTGSSLHLDYQPELINAKYTYPTDTAPGNYTLTNSITVAFDSIYDPYFNDDTSYVGIAAAGEVLVVDTIAFPFGQINHSGINDTIDISLNSVYTGTILGYPSPTVIRDTMFIGQQLGATYAGFIKWGVEQELTSNMMFSVQITYRGAKVDSCIFYYGFSGFSGSCFGGGPFALANSTTWSNVKTTNYGPIPENSFLSQSYFAQQGYPILPDSTATNTYIDCNQDNTFDAGDGQVYEQNIYIWSLVHTAKDISTGIINTASGLSVGQNYPNPFNKTTQIAYSLTKTSDVTLSICDLTGRELINNVYVNSAPGEHIINLSANSFSPGVYFYTFNVNGSKVTKKMIITE